MVEWREVAQGEGNWELWLSRFAQPYKNMKKGSLCFPYGYQLFLMFLRLRMKLCFFLKETNIKTNITRTKIPAVSI